MSALNCALANDLVAIDARLRSLSPNNSGNEVKVARYRCISACNFCLRTHRASLESPSKELSESGTKQHVVNTIKSAVDHCHTHHFVNEVGTRLLAALLLLSPLFLSQSLAVCDLSLKTCCGRCCVCSCLPAAFAGTSRPQCSLALTQGTVDKQESEDEKKEKKKGTIKKKRKR